MAAAKAVGAYYLTLHEQLTLCYYAMPHTINFTSVAVPYCTATSYFARMRRLTNIDIKLALGDDIHNTISTNATIRHHTVSHLKVFRIA